MFSSEAWLANPSSGFYNGVATQSLRFDKASSSYGLRQNSTATDAQKWTLSVWLKRTTLGAEQGILGSSSTAEYVRFESNDTIRYRLYTSGAQQISMITNAKFRDTTNFFHFVCAVDLSNTTDNDKVIMYANGTRLTLGTNTTTTTDTFDSLMNANTLYWNLGRFTNYFGGYMSDVHIIDGQQLTPTSFAETKEGAWIAKKFSGGSYGNNGARLEFKQTGDGSSTASASTIGADTSGNNNHFLDANVNAHDSNMPDSPENNFATLNPLRTNRQTETYSEGNLKFASSQTSTNPATTSTIAVSSGKWYWEVFIKAQGNTVNSVGIIDVEYGMENDSSAGYSSSSGVYAYQAAGTERSANGNHTYGNSWTDDDLIGVALDMDNGNVYFYKNGVIQNSGTALQGSLTTTGSGTYSAYSLVYNNGDQIYNFGQDGTFNAEKTAQGNTDGKGVGNFFYSVPSGYLALCTSNLPEPTISPNADTQPNDHFIPYTYTADNTDNKARTGMGFQPDFLWFKDRTTAFSNTLYDSSRGVNKYLQTNNANAENTSSDLMSSFDSDGFTTQTDGSSGNLLNYTSDNYIVWSWKANGGTLTTNDASATSVGTIDSQYQANTTAGFSIITYTGTGSAGTLAHGLSSTPEVLFIKNRTDGRSWVVGHTRSGYTGQYTLNTTGAFSTNSGSFNDVAPTSTVVGVGTDQTTNESGDSMVMYCWHSVKGYSSFGKFVGNGNANGPYIHLGFKPALFMAKSTGVENWIVLDNARPGYNPTGNYIYWNLSNAEGGAGGEYVDLLSNGVKLRTTGASVNGSATFVYMAFAEMPFKYSNAR